MEPIISQLLAIGESIAGMLWAALSVVPNKLVSADQRLFWPFMLSSVVLAAVIIGWQYGWGRVRENLIALFSPSIWFNRSSAQDVSWLVVNSLIRSWILIPLLGTRLAAAMWLALLFQQLNGDSPLLAFSQSYLWHTGLALALFSLCFFVVEDLSRFLLHRLMHRVPMLWKIHSVHHSAETMTPVTLYRVHTLEMCLYQLRSLAVFALMAGGYTYLFQSHANVWHILGVDALGFLFNSLGANLRHSHVWLSFGYFERWFISPAQHQIHHSNASEHQNLNFGTCLTIWDRLAGSHQTAGKPQRLQFGI